MCASIKNEEYRGTLYEIKDFSHGEPFASFLPGIAGETGIPLWSFYTNRGQALASFGREGKNDPILEFLPADRAYREVGLTGFRTFLKRENGRFLEPFGEEDGEDLTRTMSIGKADLKLTEEREWLKTQVQYSTLPGESFPGLLRRVTLTNRGKEAQSLQILDGLPRIIPYGMGDDFLKNMSTTAAAWIETGRHCPQMPEFRVRASIVDSLSVEEVKACNFMICGYTHRGRDHLLTPVIDGEALFGTDRSFRKPEVFLRGGLRTVLERPPVILGRYPCAFAGAAVTLGAGESVSLQSVYGYSDEPRELRHRLREMVSPEWMDRKIRESCALAEELVRPVAMKSGMPLLDGYTQFTCLDNILRGGFPRIWNRDGMKSVYHLFNRKHGDMERDYNSFVLPSHSYSSGFGNYRDVNQNRRTDVLFYPETEKAALHLFMSLIQTDGYNPLIVQPGKFRLSPDEAKDAVGLSDEIKRVLSRDFTPGEIRTLLGQDSGARLTDILSRAEYIPEADFGEGYWVDHWTYNLDLIEQYLRVYPDREEELYFGERTYFWYREQKRILPLGQRFRQEEGEVKSADPLSDPPDKASGFLMCRSTLWEKLFTLAAIKTATLDREERGLEMEAGRPGWYDALNGLPALFGSSLSDGAELLRLLRLLRESAVTGPNREISLFTDLFILVRGLLASEEILSPRDRWRRRWSLRDTYRAAVYGREPKQETGRTEEVLPFLEHFCGKMERNLKDAAGDAGGILPTYYRYTPGEWRLEENGSLIPYDLNREDLPLFLEGAVKQLKLSSREEVESIHRQVRRSPLYDEKLSMYRLNASLAGQPGDLGRACSFPGGWLENGSVWLHMEYKYLLELLRAERGQLFWEEAVHCLIPFLDPEVYGRSPYENSSFICSSLYPDARLHGKGFVARLSGATAEYLTMWTYFLMGPAPFALKGGELILCFRPLLPAGIFDGRGELAWTFLGNLPVTYVNRGGKDLFDEKSRIPRRIIALSPKGETLFEGDPAGEDAKKIREGFFTALRVEF